MTSRRDFLKGAAGTIAAGPSAAKAIAESLGTSLAGESPALRSLPIPQAAFDSNSGFPYGGRNVSPPPEVAEIWRLKQARGNLKHLRGHIDIDIAVMQSWSPAYKLMCQRMRCEEYSRIERPWFDRFNNAAKEMIVGSADSDVNTRR